MKSSSRSSKRKTKGSQKRSKKKTRSSRGKSKKSKQWDHSVSCSDEDSVSTSSVSCSTPGDDNRSKKRGRSMDRKSRKDKKKSKRSSLVSKSSGDDDPAYIMKPKRSKKNRSSGSRNKRHVERRRKDHSVNSSSSSRSRSGSVCEPSDGIEREFEKKEDKAELKERKGREKVKERSGSKRKSRHKSRSCSPCSSHSEERVLEKNSPKRLKSVIVVTKEREIIEEIESNRDDGHKDEIVFDYDDYPSKSNDSNDGVSGREAVPNSYDVSSEKRSLDEPNRESVVYDVKTSEVLGVNKQAIEESGVIIPSYVRSVDDPAIGNGNEVCTSNTVSNHDDLEAILRQKALENLLKRQGILSSKMSACRKGDHDVEVKRPSIVKVQPLDQPHEENVKSAQSEGNVVDDVKFTTTTNLPGPSVNTGTSKGNVAHLLSMKVETAPPEESGKAPNDFVISKPKVSLSTPRKEFHRAKNTWKRQLIPQESSQKNLSAPRELIVKDSKQPMSSQDFSQPKISAPQETTSKYCAGDSASSNFDCKGSSENVEVPAFAEPPISGGQSTNDKTNEADEEMQFQKKTMSVMRGGEMVQVSYKVYIPKKTPALARRQLKR